MAKDHEPITVLYKEPYEPPRKITISNTLEQLQRMVNGNIEVIPAVIFSGTPRYLVMICDEEAKLKQPKPSPNLLLRSLIKRPDIVRGPVVICAAEGEELDGLTEDEIQIAETSLRKIEIIKGVNNDD